MGIRTRHSVSGVIDPNTPENILEHPVLGRYLEIVGEDAKPFLPILHKPKAIEAEIPQSDSKAVELPEAKPAKAAPNKKNDKD